MRAPAARRCGNRAPTYLPTYLTTHLPSFPPTYLPTYLPLSTYIPTYPPSQCQILVLDVTSLKRLDENVGRRQLAGVRDRERRRHMRRRLEIRPASPPFVKTQQFADVPGTKRRY